ncbi:MAG TPA: YlzJ-like family protein [Bacillota bacterium]|nr:YlzJ-like family protein [Bacillota bacterium]
MIIYSVLPMELIMQQQETNNQLQHEETEVDGVRMVVERSTGIGEAKIVRLLSTNPQDFLNPRLMPGQTIYFRPVTSR